MQLKEYRRSTGLTLEDIATLVGLAPRSVNRHERGERLPNTVQIERYRKATGGAVQHEDWVKTARKRPALAARTFRATAVGEPV